MQTARGCSATGGFTLAPLAVGASAMSPLHVHGQRRLFVIAAAHAAIGKHAMRGDPFERLLVDFLGVRLEDQPFAWSPAPRIHQGMEAIGELVLIIVSVELRTQIDVALRTAQRAEKLSQILRIGIAMN